MAQQTADRGPSTGTSARALARAAYFSSAHFTAAAAVVAGALVAAAFWSSAHRGGLGLWVAALAGVAVLRSSTAWAINHGLLDHRPEWLHVLMACGVPALMGSVWGLGGWWMLGFGQPGQVLVLICFSIGAVMGSISNAVYWPAHVGFFVPLMGLLIVGLLDHPRPESPVLIGGALLITVLMAVQGRALGRRLREALSLAHENQQLADRLATLSHTDALTGLPNRRAWDERLTGEWARARREGHSLGMLVIDVDHFKQFNDGHGHAAGDACLRQVAVVLQSSVRQGMDQAARLGGEEFAMLLAGVDAEQLEAAALRVLHAVRALPVGGPQGLPQAVSVSVGAALTVPPLAGDPDQLFARADTALYTAKHGGRNRVVLANRLQPFPA